MLTAIYTLGSKNTCNMLIIRSKWLSNSNALYFFESLELPKSLCKISQIIFEINVF